MHPRAVKVAHRHGLHLDATARINDVVTDDDLVIPVRDKAHEDLTVADVRPSATTSNTVSGNS